MDTQTTLLDTVFRRRAVKLFEPVEIPTTIRELMLQAARVAPSSFNMQPYRFYWVESPHHRRSVANLCLGQKPAQTASVLVVAVADIGSFEATSRAQIEWMRASGTDESKVREYAGTARLGRIIFAPGPLHLFAAFKWAVFRLANLWKTMGMPPLSRAAIFKWATKSTSLACQNLMIAAEALGLNSCPMEGFDGRRLAKYLGLSKKHHEIVMVIAVGKKATDCVAQPQWRRPLENTVTIL